MMVGFPLRGICGDPGHYRLGIPERFWHPSLGMGRWDMV
jgi:hypothetical protein